jgi:hypothetical protein
MGNIAELAPATSWPVFATTNDNSPLAEAIPNPVLKAVTESYFALARMPLTIKNFEANEISRSTNAGSMKKGTRVIFISAPIDIKNIAANMSRNGTVITLAIGELLDSATNTPARKAPVATDRPKEFAINDRPNANPNIKIRSNV